MISRLARITSMTPARAIDPLLARSLKGEALPEEEAMVREWRRTAPENEIEYRQLARLVEWAARVPELIEVPPRPSAAGLIGPGRLGPRVRSRVSAPAWTWKRVAATCAWWWSRATSRSPRHGNAPSSGPERWAAS